MEQNETQGDFGFPRDVTFTVYQNASRKSAIYKLPVIYPALGLAGETGEVLEKIKKILRDKDGNVTLEDKQAIAKELGDVLWYLTQLATDLEIPLEFVALANLKKLQDRKDRGVLQGSGDNR